MSEARSGSFGFFNPGVSTLSGAAARFVPTNEARSGVLGFFDPAASTESLNGAWGAFSITGTIPGSTIYVEASYVEAGYVE